MASDVKHTRLQPHEREQQIVNGAITFFAEVGLNGQTRELAKRLGVTQGLIYRYFPDKEALIDRVYKTVFEGRWSPDWDDHLRLRDVPIRERLIDFYIDYARIIHTEEWVRIYLLAGFAGHSIQKRYSQLLRTKIFPIIRKELRHAYGVPSVASSALAEQEEEMFITLHGMIFYAGLRKWVYRIPVQGEVRDRITRNVDMFLFGMEQLYSGHKAQRGKSGERATPGKASRARKA